MQSFALLALVLGVCATPFPQGVTEAIAPDSPPPEGCKTTVSETLQLYVTNVTTSTKRSLSSVCGPIMFHDASLLTKISDNSTAPSN